jgi:hypothetical protein
VPFFGPSNMIEIEPVTGWKGRASVTGSAR